MQPGKIEHEVRHGELAALHLIPHTPYYGAHEATTLYVLVAACAWRWHGDRDGLDAVRPNIERALAWIDRDGDSDGDGLQEYQTRSPDGYYNQGWKDSGDAIVMGNGSLAKLPIALCEHQGLVVAPKRAWADVAADVFGDRHLATRLRSEADRLAGQLEEHFWWEEEGTYYLGLDGDKRPIDSVTSNPGHLLWQRAVEPERATKVVRRLLAEDMWSGWGIRTLSADHVAYDPLSYQRARCGLMTTPSRRPASGPTDSTTKRLQWPQAFSTQPRDSPRSARLSFLPDSPEMPAGSPSNTWGRTSPRRGPPGPLSTSSPRSSA